MTPEENEIHEIEFPNDLEIPQLELPIQKTRKNWRYYICFFNKREH